MGSREYIRAGRAAQEMLHGAAAVGSGNRSDPLKLGTDGMMRSSAVRSAASQIPSFERKNSAKLLSAVLRRTGRARGDSPTQSIFTVVCDGFQRDSNFLKCPPGAPWNVAISLRVVYFLAKLAAILQLDCRSGGTVKNSFRGVEITMIRNDLANCGQLLVND